MLSVLLTRYGFAGGLPLLEGLFCGVGAEAVGLARMSSMNMTAPGHIEGEAAADTIAATSDNATPKAKTPQSERAA